jgi:hypothetical protein
MSNGRQHDSVQFKAEETESRTGTEFCILVTVLESREEKKVVIMTRRVHRKQRRKRGWRQLFLLLSGFFCKENGGLCFSVGGGDHFFKWYNGDGQTL